MCLNSLQESHKHEIEAKYKRLWSVETQNYLNYLCEFLCGGWWKVRFFLEFFRFFSSFVWFSRVFENVISSMIFCVFECGIGLKDLMRSHLKLLGCLKCWVDYYNSRRIWCRLVLIWRCDSIHEDHGPILIKSGWFWGMFWRWERLINSHEILNKLFYWQKSVQKTHKF
jgi:hypothetical protein